MSAPSVPKTSPGNFFEDFRLGQQIRHATPRTVTVGVYSNTQAGPFFLSQKKYLDSRPVPGIDAGTAFTIPGTGYVVAEDGQAVSVVGDFPPDTPARKPLRVTPELTALLASAATLMQ